MLDFFAGRRFNLIDLAYNAAATAMIVSGEYWWAAGAYAAGLALSISLEAINGEYE